MLKNIPEAALQVAREVLENNDVLESCLSCGAVLGSCIHSDVLEDIVMKQDIPTDSEPEAQLSGKQEEIVINPEYKTFTSRQRQAFTGRN